MTLAAGANARIAYGEETTWGTAATSMALLKAALPGAALTANVAQLVSNALNARRALENARAGDVNVAGPVPIELPLLGIGTILKHALGPAVTGHAVTQGAGLTDLTAQYAEDGTTAGAGTLSLSGDNATWAANSDTAGAAVDVSAAGYYTLESATDGNALVVYSAGSPSGTSATVTVSATNYVHTIKRGALPVGLTLEYGYTDIAQYHAFLGCRINQLGLTIPESGLVTGSMDVIGKSVATMAGTPIDATLDESAHVPFADLDTTFEENGSAIATITNLAINIGNNLQAQPVAGSKYIGALQEGKGAGTGQVALFFEDATYVNKVLGETASSLKATFTQAGGSIEIYMPSIKYFGAAGAGIPTDQGIIMPFDWTALYDATEETDIKIVIKNTESAI